MKLRNQLGLAMLVAAVTTGAVVAAGGGVKKTTVHGVGWYASFDEAKAEAKRTGKPILLLSMFGKLDEEMACANARTLRATLFKDPEFKKLITEDVIPAWEMVRAVPKIEIDLGDGKKIKRTVRGNAVMYVCNSDGKVVDAYPGVYTAQDFMPAIRESLDLTKMEFKDVLAFHTGRGKAPPRTLATMGKVMVESPTLELLGAKPIKGAKITETSKDPARQRFLNAASRIADLSLIPMNSSEAAEILTGGPADERDPAEVAAEIIRNDSANNMRRVRPVIHLWLASEKELPTPLQARDPVLETILKIPYKDPYFGLKDVLLPGTPG